MKKSFPNYNQLDMMDCGAACLKIIAKYYGRNYSLETLRNRSYITRRGVSMLGISDAAESIGFRTNGIRLSFEQLVMKVHLPCILHWNQNHFVVCYSIKRKKRFGKLKDDYTIKISDPMGEKYTLNKEEFLKMWGSTVVKDEDLGTVLVLTPTPEFYALEDEPEVKNKNIGYFFRYLLPYKLQLFQIVLGMVIGSVLQILFPFLTQAIVDQGIGDQNIGFITLILIAQLILFITQLVVEFIRSWLMLHVNARINISLISDFLIKLMKLPLRFFDSKNVGDLLQRIGDHTRIENFLTGSSLVTLFSFTNFIIFALILGYYSLTILGIFILGNTLYILWILLFMRYRKKLDYKRFAQASAEQSSLIQIVTGMREIKLNNCEKHERWKWERIQVRLFNISIKSLALGQYQQSGSVFFSQTTALIITFIAAKSVVDGNMTLGMMMAVSYIIGQLSGPISKVIEFIRVAQDAKISLERLNEIHNKKDEVQSFGDKVNEIPEVKDIIIKDLSFNYEGAHRNYVLKDINLTIPANKITAIVGASGSGKTTLIKLMLNFYTPTLGEIRIDNIALDELNPYMWREVSGAVMQDGFIFSDTIANNIAVGVDKIDKKLLKHAVEVANIKDFIESLPLKYNTHIGMDGSGISQGQRQRILIARAVYKNPDFLFFDEATNALDANNERIILDNLNSFYKGKTVVIVAHRLTTVQHADNIVVLDNGRVIEEGTHEQLTRKKGAYYTLVKNQLELGL